MVVTAGWSNGAISSAFPPGIPIGEVSDATVGEQETYQRVHLQPFADLRNLDLVQVATGGPKRPGVRGVIITRRSAIRIALIMVLSVVLQVSFFSYLSFFGTTPDIMPLVVISLGLLGGALVGRGLRVRGGPAAGLDPAADAGGLLPGAADGRLHGRPIPRGD